MAAPAWETHEAENIENKTSQVVAVPAGTVDDDFLVAAGSWDSGGGGGPTIGTLVPPSGFDPVDSDNAGSGTAYDFRHRVAASEPADYTWGWDQQEDVVLALARISGADPTTPVNVVSSVNSGTSDTPTCPDVTTTVDECLVIRIVMIADSDWDGSDPYPASHTGRFALVTGAGGSGEAGLAMATAEKASAGAVGTADFLLTGSTQWHAFTIAIAPEDTTTPTTPNAPTETTGSGGEPTTSRNEVLSGANQDVTGEWVASGSGTNEYYFQAVGGGDPGITIPSPTSRIQLGGSPSLAGTLGSLADHEHAFGDNDSLGFDTLYIRDDSGDPDTTNVVIVNMLATEYIEVTSIDNTLGNEIRVEYQGFESGEWNGSTSQVAITGTTMTFTIEDLPADLGIQYRAIVINTDEDPDEESDPSSTATIRSAPEAPWEVTAEEGSVEDEVDISIEGVSEYPHRVWEILAASPARLVGTMPAGTTTLVDDGGGAGLDDDTYQYEVRSYHDDEDDFSGAVESGTVAISTAVVVAATKQSFSLTEYDADVTVTHRVEATKQVFELTTYSADITVTHNVEATKQGFTLNTYAATVTVGDAQAGGDSDYRRRKGNPASFFRPGF